MDRLRSIADGKTTVTLLTEFNHATLEAIASVCEIIILFEHCLFFLIKIMLLQIAFGMDIDVINDPKNDLNNWIAEVLTGIQMLIFEPFFKVI